MQRQRVLFVDDEPSIIEGLKRMLRPLRQEWEMEFTESGYHALELMNMNPFDVIIADMRMPGMNGAQLLKQVSENFPGTVRFILSGYSNRELILQSVGYAHQYLAKPCDAETLRNTVRNSLALRTLLANEKLHAVISNIHSLPTPPAVYHELVNQLQSENASVKSVADIVSQDVATTAKLLQIVNSAFFGLPTHVESVFQAVSLLGFDTVHALVMAVGLFAETKTPELNGISVKSIYAHSIPSGTIAQRLAKALSLDRKLCDDALMAGLLHDIGKLIMLNYFRDEYNQALKIAQEQKLPLTSGEKEVLGVTHADIGAHLLSLWGLPDSIVEAVAYHHSPGMTINPTLNVLTSVYLANLFVHEQVPSRPNRDSGGFDQEYLESVGAGGKLSELRNLCVHEESIVK